MNHQRPEAGPDLSSDIELFGGDRSTIEPEEFLAVDDQMRSFVRTSIAGVSSKQAKLHRMMQSLFRRGEYTLNYEAEHSFTASQTFHRRSGNCLSTTALLVSMAREAGLEASFQDFDKRPDLRVDDSLWIYERHINAIVVLDRGNRVTVDFDRRQKRNGEGTAIADSVAAASFYSNLAVTAMKDGDLGLAHANFRRAIGLYAGLGFVWNNIGVLYNRVGLEERAEEIFLHAINLDSREFRAMSNLAALYRRTDRVEQAQVLELRLERVRRNDPYYLYTLASRAYDARDFEESVAYLRRAIRLKDDEPVFHELLRDVQSMQAGGLPEG